MRRPSLTREGLPALVIAGALVAAYTEQGPESGIIVRAVAGGEPTRGYVRITGPQVGPTLAGGRIPPGESVRYRLQPGAYMIRPEPRRGLRAAPVPVRVRQGRFEPVTVRYRPGQRRRRP
jgi:hypothetical protein